MEAYATPALLISTIALLLVVYIVLQVLLDFNLYSKAEKFPTPSVYFFGTLTAFLLLGMHVAIARTEICKEEGQPSSGLLASSLFYVFYILFTLNLTLRAEYYVNAARLPSTVGSFWLFLALLVLLYLLAYSPTNAMVFLFFPIIWTIYLIWNWVNKI
jgi:hypothetical protein